MPAPVDVVRMGRIIRHISDTETQTLLYGEYDKLNAIWYPLMETFPYDYRNTSTAFCQQETHNISIQEEWPNKSGKFVGGVVR